MLFRATKDTHEHEEAEAERLVRRAPKVKPPRHDLRRERLKERDPDVEGDPDTTGDRDLSMNYKVIGGSVSHRVLSRFIMARRVAKRVVQANDLVKVRLKDDPSKVVNVSEDTLRKEPGKYEELDDTEDEADERQPSKQESTPKKQETGGPGLDEGNDSKAREALEEMAKNDEEFASILRGLVSPQADLYGLAQKSPNMPAKPFVRNRTLPKGVETLGDLQRALTTKAPKSKSKKESPKPKTPPPESPKETSPTEKSPAEEAPEEKPSKKEEPEKESPKGEEPSGKSKAKPKEIKPKRRKVTPEESDAAIEALIDTFPPDMAAHLMESELHPDDVKRLVSDYHVAKSRSIRPSNLADYSTEAAKFFEVDPRKVPAPKVGETSSGVEKPFDELTPEEQAEAWEAHRVRTVAMSLAAHDQISGTLAKVSGAPESLSRQLATYMLRTPSHESPEEKEARAEKASLDLFQEVVGQDVPEEVSDRTVRNVLSAIKDAGARRVAVAYFQGHDYQAARARFLNDDSEEAINEWQSPSEIVSGLKEASSFLRRREKRYPSEVRATNTALVFRNRVVSQLRDLVPEKYPFIQEKLDEIDAEEYDAAAAKYKKDVWKHQKQIRDAETSYHRDYQKYLEKLEKAEWVQPEPPEPVQPLTTEERLFQEGIEEPEVEDQKAFAAYLKRRKKFEKDFQKDLDKYQAEHAKWESQRTPSEEEEEPSSGGDGGPYRTSPTKGGPPKRPKIAPPKSVAERLSEQGIVEPSEPVKPARYDLRRKDEKGLSEEGRKLWEEQLRRSGVGKQAAHVVSSFVGLGYSSYLRHWTMGNIRDRAPFVAATQRESVYLGIDPLAASVAGLTPYVGWQQAEACELGEKDYNSILSAAREWLRSPVLSKDIEGIVPDTQFRAAIDLALRTHEDGRYSVGLHPTVYNNLLVKLAGESPKATLLTVREASSIYENPPGEVSMNASAQIREFAARVASEHPELAYDLVALATKLAGEVPPQFLEHIKEKKEDKDEKKDEGQKKEASSSVLALQNLKSLIIRTAVEHPNAREAFLPLLQAVKNG